MYMLTFLAYVECKFESVGVKRVQGTDNVIGRKYFLGALSGHISVYNICINVNKMNYE